MLGIQPIQDVFDVLKYLDEIKEYDKEILNNIYYGSLHDSIYDDFSDTNDTYDSEDTQYENSSYDTYYFLTESY